MIGVTLLALALLPELLDAIADSALFIGLSAILFAAGLWALMTARRFADEISQKMAASLQRTRQKSELSSSDTGESPKSGIHSASQHRKLLLPQAAMQSSPAPLFSSSAAVVLHRSTSRRSYAASASRTCRCSRGI